MKNVLFIAPPAGGKGTQSEYLERNFGYYHISSGDLLRELDKESELGKQVNEIISKGNLVSDEIIAELIKNKLLSLDENVNFILDGFPRNIKQADILEKTLSEINRTLDVVIELDVPYEVCLERITGRITCPKCKRTYNKYFVKPINEGICDDCNTELVSRADDNAETFKKRFDIYTESTKPLLDYYKNMNKLEVVDGLNNTSSLIANIIKND